MEIPQSGMRCDTAMSLSLAPARRPLAVALLAGLTVFGVASSASAATAVTYDCQASAVGQTGTFTVNASVTASAPSTVAADSALTITESVGSITVPTSASGYTVKSINGIKLEVPVPSNATYDSASLAGGSNYSDPGLTFTAVISVIGISVNASAVGYPSTTPSLTSTTIG